MEYSLFAALHEDVNSGWIWINKCDFKQRAVIRIVNTTTKKSVYCEVLQIDDNFLNYYNARGKGRKLISEEASALVINQWYRKLLGDLSTQSRHELEITEVANLYGRIRSCLQHPQVIVRIATWLGIVSVAEGLLGILFGIISLFK